MVTVEISENLRFSFTQHEFEMINYHE